MSEGFPQTFGPYQLLRALGRGGMAEVFLAQAPSAQGDARLVALKRMHAGVSEDNGAVEMLVAEARLAMQFDHPNVAATFELGNHEGAYYFLMEYVDGLDLAAVARLAETLGERLSPAFVVWCALGVARGLAHAHELSDEEGTPLGVVHRDVSPQNVLLNREGQIKLIDFGVAKVATRIQQTMAGVIKGKYAYMSPEQASAEAVDGRSDVFSLGICLHEWLTGEPLFRGPNMISPFAILRAVREEPIDAVHEVVDEVDAELGAIVAACLERDREARWPSAGALADALRGWLKTHAPHFGAISAVAYVDDLVHRAPQDTLPQRAIATPPLSKMDAGEFAPSALSVVARSPLETGAPELELLTEQPPTRQPPTRQPPTRRPPSRQAAPARQPSRQMPAARGPGLPAGPQSRRPPPRSATPHPAQPGGGHGSQTGSTALPTPSQAPRPPAQRSRRPRRRTMLQLLAVGALALVFALGWSIVATLKKLGTF